MIFRTCMAYCLNFYRVLIKQQLKCSFQRYLSGGFIKKRDTEAAKVCISFQRKNEKTNFFTK